MTETPAGRMARTYAELDRRELSALMCESAQAIADRAEDAQAIAYVKASIDLHNHCNDRPVAYSDCASYWAALP